jgi:ribonuclease P protein component
MTERVPKLKSLAKRAQFLRVRGGGRATAQSFVLEGKKREPTRDAGATGPLFGFTITKKIGNAVKRNLIRRRLKSALTELAPALADPTMDYVVVARGAAANTELRFIAVRPRNCIEAGPFRSGQVRAPASISLVTRHDERGVTVRVSRFCATSATSSAEMRSVARAFDPSTTRPDYSRDRNEQAPA